MSSWDTEHGADLKPGSTLEARLMQELTASRQREATAKARANKLAAANALLRESAERLGAVEDIDAFLGQVLLTIADLLGARSSTVWLHDNKTQLGHLRFVVEDGQAIPADKSGHPNANEPFRIDHPAIRIPRDGTAAAGLFLSLVESDPGLSEAQRSYLTSRCVHAVLGVPMVLNGEHFGNFTIRLVDQRPISDEDRELIQALANQAAVALHLTRLAEQAREAAVARERAEQAVRRAEALARIGEAGRSTLQRLSEKPDIDAFLGHVLTVCAEQFAACGGGVWLDNGGVNTLALTLEGGVVQRREVATHPGARREEQAVVRGDGPAHRKGSLLIDGWEEIARNPSYEPYRDHLRSLGVRQILQIPMFFGGEYRGSLTLRFTEERALAPEEEELAHALANQAVLALEMQRLADQAREAAVVHEREVTTTAERARFSRDVHDRLAQGYATLGWELGTLETEARQQGSERLAERLACLSGVAREHVADARRTIEVLRTGVADESLCYLLRNLLESCTRSGEHRVTMDLEPVALAGEVARELACIAKEAVNNALRHADAKSVRVSLRREDCELVLTIADDGKGFDSEAVLRGVGFRSMQERADEVNAKLAIVSAPARGAALELRLPVAADRGEIW